MADMAREKAAPVSITTARAGHSSDVEARQRRYLLSMLLRTLCFVAAVIASGWLRWVFVAGALFLPYIAVVLANAGNRKDQQVAEAYTPAPFGILGTRGEETPSPHDQR